jgi:hypothetical protein
VKELLSTKHLREMFGAILYSEAMRP